MAKEIRAVITVSVVQNAGTRDGNGVDTTTCFGIPGHNLPRRHCDVNFQVSVAVADDLSVYLAIHNGEVKQYVYGQGYSCRFYACPHYFRMYIPHGATGWSDVQFFDSGDNRCDDDITGIVMNGSLTKTYDKSVPFQWMFGPTQSLAEGGSYDEGYITAGMPHRVSHNGGESVSDSHYCDMGKLTDYDWTEELQDSSDGHVYICGGILYPDSNVTSDINAEAVEITIPGINTWFWYYPGDVIKGGSRKSLNRANGYFYMKKSSSNHKFMKMHDGWRDCKNCPKEGFEHTVFRLEGDWVKAELTGMET